MSWNGCGDDSNAFMSSTLFPVDCWNISAIRYNGKEFDCFINGQKLYSQGGIDVKNSKLYIGGISNSGIYDSGVYWGYGNGYYRNLAIYDEALSDEDLENYSF